MYNQESASLILRTSDLTAGTQNNVGRSDQFFTNMTWSNINLRTLLGSMYDKFDTFNLVPVTFAQAQGGGGFGTADEDRTTSIFISGLPFTNCVYNTETKTNRNSAIINTFKFIRSNSTTVYGGQILTFTKNQELVNINIYYEFTTLTTTTTI